MATNTSEDGKKEMKQLIYQVSVGRPPPFYKTCTDSVGKYCKRFGFDHIVQEEPIIRLRPVKSCRSELAVERYGYLPHFEKANAFKYLDDYDQLAIIDADIYVRQAAPNIFEEMGNATFAGVRECDMPLTPVFQGKVKSYSMKQYGNLKEMVKTQEKGQIPFFNTGVILFDTKSFKPFLMGDTPEQFVKRKEFEPFVNGEGEWRWASDQSMLNWWFVKEGIKTKPLSWKWNALYNGVRDNVLPESYFLHFFLSKKLLQKEINIDTIIEKYK
jgi:hypothetical protein